MQFLINIDVNDLEKAVTFYANAFDLQIGRRFGGDGVEMLGGPAPIYLLVKAEGTQAATTSAQLRSYARHWTPIHLDIVVDDVDAAVSKAIAAGAVLEKPAATYRWGRIAGLADPFGNGFCILQFLGKGYDEIAS